MLKIWGRRTSINVQKVMWTTAELGLACERVDAGGEFGGLDTPDFRRLNPNGLVPVMEDGDFVLWESHAIVRYLAQTRGDGLVPHDPRARARADQWMEWAGSMLYSPIVMTCFYQFVRVPAADRDHKAVAGAGRRLAERMSNLDRHLSGRHFIEGERLTVADIAVGSLMYRYFVLPIERPALPNVAAWYERLTSRQPYREHVMVDLEPMKVPGA
jgi:glutathione S-transferase